MTTDQEANDLAYISDLAGQKMGQMVFEQFELRDKAINALRLQELCSTIQKEGYTILPDDPRYTEWIGEWDGYKAPEQRIESINYLRKQMRREVLETLTNDT